MKKFILLFKKRIVVTKITMKSKQVCCRTHLLHRKLKFKTFFFNYVVTEEERGEGRFLKRLVVDEFRVPVIIHIAYHLKKFIRILYK